jgi:hypothetical protein
MVILAEGLRQFGVGDLRSINRPLENNKNGVAIPVNVFFPVSLVRQLQKLLP